MSAPRAHQHCNENPSGWYIDPMPEGLHNTQYSDMSSLKVPAGYRVTLYEGQNGTGRQRVINGPAHIPCFWDVNFDGYPHSKQANGVGNMNDVIRSYRVERLSATNGKTLSFRMRGELGQEDVNIGYIDSRGSLVYIAKGRRMSRNWETFTIPITSRLQIEFLNDSVYYEGGTRMDRNIHIDRTSFIDSNGIGYTPTFSSPDAHVNKQPQTTEGIFAWQVSYYIDLKQSTTPAPTTRPPTPCPPLTNGQSIKVSDTGKMYRMDNGVLRLYPTADIYTSWGSPPLTSFTADQLTQCKRGADMGPYEEVKYTINPITDYESNLQETLAKIKAQYDTTMSEYKAAKEAEIRALQENNAAAIENARKEQERFVSELTTLKATYDTTIAQLNDIRQSIQNNTTLLEQQQQQRDALLEQIKTIEDQRNATTAAPATPDRFGSSVYVILDAGAWMETGTLRALTMTNGAITTAPFQFKDLRQTWVSSTKGKLRCLEGSGEYIETTSDCLVPRGAISSSSTWTFTRLPTSRYHFSIMSNDCGRRLEPNVSDSVVLTSSRDSEGGWYIVPVGSTVV
jgi:hypothetical protein